MIKNICIMSSVIFCMALTSCKMSFSAVTPTQKYTGSVTIYDVHGESYEVREVEDWKK